MDKITNFFKTGSFEPQVVLAYGDSSIFLAKVFGLYLIIMGLFCLIRFDAMKSAADDFMKNRAFSLISGVIALIIGLLIVVAHNVWVWDWPLIITLLGYLSLLKGILRLFFPELETAWAKCYTSITFLVINGIFWILVGLFLTYEGFWAM